MEGRTNVLSYQFVQNRKALDFKPSEAGFRVYIGSLQDLGLASIGFQAFRVQLRLNGFLHFLFSMCA